MEYRWDTNHRFINQHIYQLKHLLKDHKYVFVYLSQKGCDHELLTEEDLTSLWTHFNFLPSTLVFAKIVQEDNRSFPEYNLSNTPAIMISLEDKIYHIDHSSSAFTTVHGDKTVEAYDDEHIQNKIDYEKESLLSSTIIQIEDLLINHIMKRVDFIQFQHMKKNYTYFYFSGDIFNLNNYTLQIVLRSNFSNSPEFFYSDRQDIIKKYDMKPDTFYFCDREVEYECIPVQDNANMDFYMLYHWINRKQHFSFMDIETDTAWHEIVEKNQPNLVFFYGEENQGYKDRQILREFDQILHKITDHEFVVKCDIQKPSCQAYIKKFGLHGRELDTPGLQYASPFQDSFNHFRLFTKFKGSFEDPQELIDYITDCKNGKNMETAYHNEDEDKEEEFDEAKIISQETEQDNNPDGVVKVTFFCINKKIRNSLSGLFCRQSILNTHMI